MEKRCLTYSCILLLLFSDTKAAQKPQSSSSIKQISPYEITMRLEKANGHAVLYKPRERSQQEHD